MSSSSASAEEPERMSHIGDPNDQQTTNEAYQKFSHEIVPPMVINILERTSHSLLMRCKYHARNQNINNIM